MSYSSEVLADSPLAYWRLGESSGTSAADSSGNSRTATHSGSLTVGATGLLTGDADKSVDYAGGKTEVASATWMDVSSITAEVWFRLDTTPSSGATYTLFSRYYQETSGQKSWQLAIWNDSGTIRPFFQALNSGGTAVVSLSPTGGTGALSTGVTYHLVATYSGGTGRLYLNGTQIATQSVAHTMYSSGQPITIGAHGGSGVWDRPTDGRIDEAAFYGTALSGTRVLDHYNAGTATVVIPQITAPLAGSGAFSAAVLAVGVTTAALTGSGAFSATTVGVHAVTAPLSGSGAFSATTEAIGTSAIDANLTGSGAYSAATSGAIHSVTASWTGAGAFTASTYAPGATLEVTAPLSGSGEFTASTDAFQPPQTNHSNRTGGRTRSGYAVAEFIPPAADPVAFPLMVHDYEQAQAFTAATVTNGRASYQATYQPVVRDWDQIIIGGRDVTFFRGAPTPTPQFQLLSPLMYGPGRIEFPQIDAVNERFGHGDLKWLRKWAPVVVRRRDGVTGAVKGIDYRGFLNSFDISGTTLACTLAGHVNGRMADDYQPTPGMRRVSDLGRLAYYAMNGTRVRFTPKLGPKTGIKIPTFGGTDLLSYTTELLAKGQTLDGDQWTIMPRANGTWGLMKKDRETVDFTIYFDDARQAADLTRDFSEEHNVIYAEAVDKDGRRITGRKYPRLSEGEPPPYPKAGGSPFGVGTTNDDLSNPEDDALTAMLSALIQAGYLSLVDGVDWEYDQQAARAIKMLQDEADLPETGIMNPATWRALYDLDRTGYSLNGTVQLPMAQDPRTRIWNRTSSGAYSTRNPRYDKDVHRVARKLDMGGPFTAQQVREFSRAKIVSGDNWVGSVPLNMAVIRGVHVPGTPIDPADVMQPREIRPGMNAWVPNFDGGTLFHVSGVDVPAGGRVPVVALDTMARDTMEVWEVITRNRDSRSHEARQWLRDQRSSRNPKDSMVPWESQYGGRIGRPVQLRAGRWNHFVVPAGQAGNIAQVRIRTIPHTRFAVIVSALEISEKRMNSLVSHPLSEAGTEKWQGNRVSAFLESKGFVYGSGEFHAAAGYSPKTEYRTNAAGNLVPTGAPVTGVLKDYGSWPYYTQGEPVLHVMVWAENDARIPLGWLLRNGREEGT